MSLLNNWTRPQYIIQKTLESKFSYLSIMTHWILFLLYASTSEYYTQAFNCLINVSPILYFSNTIRHINIYEFSLLSIIHANLSIGWVLYVTAEHILLVGFLP